MNEIKIPKEFQLFGRTIKIEYDDRRCDDKNAYGLSEYGNQKIILSKFEGIDEIPKVKIEQTFLHELLHQILDTLCERDLSRNEQFVNNVSCLLHQALKTAKYHDCNVQKNTSNGVNDDVIKNFTKNMDKTLTDFNEKIKEAQKSYENKLTR